MRRRTLVIGSVVLVGAALVLFCCASGERRGAEEPTSSAEPAAQGDSDGVVAPAGTATDGAAPSGTATDGAAPSGTATDGAGAPTWAHDAGAADTAGPTDGGTSPTPGGGARIVQALQTSDPRDLKLLSSIERELHRDPPAEIHALVKLRKSGAGRAELARAIAALSELPLRVMALRWLDEVTPAGDGGAR